MKTGPSLALSLAAFLWPLWADAASLTARIDHAHSPLGAPISLTFTARGLSLDRLDLRPLARDFDLGPATSSQSGEQQTLSVNIYPMHTGKIRLPAFTLGGARTRPLAVQVEAASALVPAVSSSLSVQPAQPMVRQPTRLVLDIHDDGSLLWQRPHLPVSDGLFLKSRGETQVQATCSGTPCTLHRYVWEVMPTRAGLYSVHLPMLAASKFGAALRFPPPRLQFTAQALPGWLPLGVPVGPLQVSAAPLPPRWPLHRPLVWSIAVRGGLGADELRHLLGLQLEAYPQLSAYPPAIENMTAGDKPGPGFNLRATIYLRPQRGGVLHIPRLVFPWFDPVRGELQAVMLQGRDIRVFNPLYQRLAWSAWMLAAVLAFLLPCWLAYRFANGALARRRCLQAVSSAADAASLSRALRRCSWHLRSPPAPTLGEWWNQLPADKQTADLARHVQALEAASYGGVRACDLSSVKEGLLKSLRKG